MCAQVSSRNFTSSPRKFGKFVVPSGSFAVLATLSPLRNVIYSVTISPVSMAAYGLVSKTRGLSLRFPRFIKEREDKGLEDASTPQFLARMWESQQGQGKDLGGVDEGELVDVIGDTDIEEESSGD